GPAAARGGARPPGHRGRLRRLPRRGRGPAGDADPRPPRRRVGLPDPRVDLPRAERLRRALDRDGGACAWCRRALTPDSASVDHLVPRLKGGPAWPENEVAACRPCNRARGHTAPAEWLADCEARGLEPDRALVVSRLAELQAAIGARGGQRRARPYLDAQLRRLR